MGRNTRLIQRRDERWEVLQTEEADFGKKHLINYKEWISVEGKLRDLPIAEQEAQFLDRNYGMGDQQKRGGDGYMSLDSILCKDRCAPALKIQDWGI